MVRRSIARLVPQPGQWTSSHGVPAISAAGSWATTACPARRRTPVVVGLRLQLRRAQAEAGDIVLIYADESEALTHPYLARAKTNKQTASARHNAPRKPKSERPDCPMQKDDKPREEEIYR